jgi:aromatic-amino-acid transaminase
MRCNGFTSVISGVTTVFQNVDAYAGDPILSLMEAFQQDPRADKVNLSIGLYYNEQAIIPQLEAVRQAADRPAEPAAKGQPLSADGGLAPYRRAVRPCCLATIIRRCVPDASPPSRRWAVPAR